MLGLDALNRLETSRPCFKYFNFFHFFPDMKRSCSVLRKQIVIKIISTDTFFMDIRDIYIELMFFSDN